MFNWRVWKHLMSCGILILAQPFVPEHFRGSPLKLWINCWWFMSWNRTNPVINHSRWVSAKMLRIFFSMLVCCYLELNTQNQFLPSLFTRNSFLSATALFCVSCKKQPVAQAFSMKWDQRFGFVCDSITAGIIESQSEKYPSNLP